MKKSILLIVSLLFSNLSFADISYERMKKEYDRLLEKKYILLPYKGNYLIPISYNDNTNSDLYSELEASDPKYADRGKFYKNIETELQISFLILTNKSFFNTNFSTFLGYTQRSYWQVYNGDWSRPFRETNYAPEFFARYIFQKQRKFLGMNFMAYDFGIIHQSNGQVQELSRSWNRVYARAAFLTGNTALNFTLWYRLPESIEDDDNPYMHRYRGYGEINIRQKIAKGDVQITLLPGTDHLSGELAVSYPWSEGLRFFAKYSYGYGISLQEYDYEMRRIGVGISLSDPFFGYE